ncbi:MAG: UDP-N-acetylmuramoyl-tripeptide--D-alanyl-D-alanine ligase [Gammaproteobacteria bacterium]|jgi:UDP-N-acetylmuramoyl-tripeptide--D-alanyl-D-alanine ligase
MVGCELSLTEVAPAVDGTLNGEDTVFHGVTTDSRAVTQGQLFVAITGPNFDAHDFAGDAQQSGAAALLVERPLDLDIAQLVVKDSLLALGKLAAYWRSRLSIPVVAVTGSNGKTTVKEMLASIFAGLGETLATRGNLNNHIGVPLTLLSIGKQHKAAVIEMGANHPGEIAYLTDITRPQVAVINNAAAAHLEGFGSLEGVAKAKGEIYQGLDKDGVAVINADDRFAPLWKELTKDHKTLTFGLQNAADVHCQWSGDINGNRLDVQTPAGDFQCTLQLLGKHNVMNALAATAVAAAASVDVQVIAEGINALQAVPGRLQLKQGAKGSRVIDDTYNANPSSLVAGLDVLAASPGRKFLVLGDMGELGDNTLELHQQAGADAAKLNIDRVFTLGGFSQEAAQAFGENGQHFEDVDQLIQAILPKLSKDVTVLVKGSRMMKMERVVQALAEQQS